MRSDLLERHAVFVTGVVAAALVPAVVGEARLAALVIVVGTLLALLSLNVLLGYAGQISLGQAAFVGTGAFIAINAVGRGLPVWAAILVAGVGTGALTAVVGLPSLRIGGLAVGIATLVYASAAERYLFEQPWFTGAGAGHRMPAVIGHAAVYQLYLFALALLVAVLLVDRQVLASKLGRAFVTVREAEERAVAFGVVPGPSKLRAYGLSGVLAGIAGGIIAAITGTVSGTDFAVLESLLLLAVAVVGGVGSRAGVMVAGIILLGVPELVDVGNDRLAPLAGGLVLVLTILFLPEGVGGLLRRLVGLQLRLVVSLATLLGLVVVWRADAERVAESSGALGDGVVVATGASGWRWAAIASLLLLLAAVWRFARREPVDVPVEGALRLEQDSAERARVAAADAAVVRTVPRDLSLGMPSRVLFEARGVTVRFGGVTALEDVSMEVRSGEVVGLIGANGAGKSTLYNVVSGFVTPEPSSSVRYRGVELLDLPPARRTRVGVARTFQHMGLVRPQTVQDNVLLAQHWLAGYDEFAGVLRLGGSGRTERQLRARAEKALRIFGLEHHRGAVLGSLSYGTMRMVELAAAVATGADLLFFDEASAGLSPDEAHALADRFHALRDELGLTLVVVEHHVPLIASTCDYVYCLASGRQLAEGDPASVQSHPEVIAEFLGRSRLGDRGAPA